MNKKIISVSLTTLLLFVLFANSTTSKTLETQETNNNYAVIIGIPECIDAGGFNKQSAILFKNTIDTGFYTEIYGLGTASASYDSDYCPSYYIDKYDIKETIDWLYDKSKSGDCTLLFYYDGHGTETHISDSTGFHVSHSELKDWFEKFDSSDKLVLIFETCHGGNLTGDEKSKDINDNLMLSKYLKTKTFSLFQNIFLSITGLKEKLNLDKKGFTSESATNENNIKTSQDYSETPSDFRFTNLVKTGRIVISACRKDEAAWYYTSDWNKSAVTYGAFTKILCDKLTRTDCIEPAFDEAVIPTYLRVLREHYRRQHPQMVDNIDGDVKIK